MFELLANFDWLTPETILETGGYWLLLIIVFLETGFFFGFFLPGDSLLLTAGLLCGSEYLSVSIYQLVIGLILAGFFGSVFGYMFGHRTGGYLFTIKESIFFKRKYLKVAEDFYLKHGNKAFVIGRFLPIARTFIPIIAGLVKAHFPTFLWYNAFGTTIWISFFVLGGYWLHQIFPDIGDYLEWMILLIFCITSTPLVVTWLKEKKKATHSQ